MTAAGDGELPGAVLRFKKRIDAGALLDLADRLRLQRAPTRHGDAR